MSRIIATIPRITCRSGWRYSKLCTSTNHSFIDTVLGDNRAPRVKDWLQEEQDILRSLKENLKQAQNRQKEYADRHRIERSFEVGDLVYLWLEPYRQSSLKGTGKEKWKPHFYVPSHWWSRLWTRTSEGLLHSQCFPCFLFEEGYQAKHHSHYRPSATQWGGKTHFGTCGDSWSAWEGPAELHHERVLGMLVTPTAGRRNVGRRTHPLAPGATLAWGQANFGTGGL